MHLQLQHANLTAYTLKLHMRDATHGILSVVRKKIFVLMRMATMKLNVSTLRGLDLKENLSLPQRVRKRWLDRCALETLHRQLIAVLQISKQLRSARTRNPAPHKFRWRRCGRFANGGIQILIGRTIVGTQVLFTTKRSVQSAITAPSVVLNGVFLIAS